MMFVIKLQINPLEILLVKLLSFRFYFRNRFYLLRLKFQNWWKILIHIGYKALSIIQYCITIFATLDKCFTVPR